MNLGTIMDRGSITPRYTSLEYEGLVGDRVSLLARLLECGGAKDTVITSWTSRSNAHSTVLSNNFEILPGSETDLRHVTVSTQPLFSHFRF